MVSFLAENIWAVWLAVAVFFALLELATTALLSIWFVPAAVITGIVSLFVSDVIIQILIFVVLSFVFLLIFRRFYRNRLLSEEKLEETNSRLIGRTAIVVDHITPDGGKVLLGDVYWRAICKNNEIPAGATVKIAAVEGTTLVVFR